MVALSSINARCVCHKSSDSDKTCCVSCCGHCVAIFRSHAPVTILASKYKHSWAQARISVNSSCTLYRWQGICWDALVCLVMLAFGANVVMRLRHSLHSNLWRTVYLRSALLLDSAILLLQAASKSQHSKLSRCSLHLHSASAGATSC